LTKAASTEGPGARHKKSRPKKERLMIETTKRTYFFFFAGFFLAAFLAMLFLSFVVFGPPAFKPMFAHARAG
jgi:hypothetical protein